MNAPKVTPTLPDAQTVIGVQHYTDRLFSFKVTRPKTLRFRSGELDRELSAVGLVVGKYIQRYSLDVGHFEVVIEQPGGMLLGYVMDPEAARKLYIQRIDLVTFLESLP